MLGHAHIKTTMRYVHSVPAARDAELLAAAFAAADGAERPRARPVPRTWHFLRN